MLYILIFKSNSNKKMIIIITEVNTQMVAKKSYLFNNVGLFIHFPESARDRIETDPFLPSQELLFSISI